MTDVDLFPGPAPGEGIDVVRYGGDAFAVTNGLAVHGVLTIPAGVRAFSFVIGGGMDALGNTSGVGRGVFVNVPCEPGEVWSLGGGDPPNGSNTLGAQAHSPWPGGNGGGPFIQLGVGRDDDGRAGGDAAFLVRRVDPDVEATWETWAIAGGMGGHYNPGSDPGGLPVPATGPGPVAVGPPIPYAPTSPTGTPLLRAGGPGGGVPPGDWGGSVGAPGTSGGSYLPASYNLGGPAAPAPSSFAPGYDFDLWTGGVAVWWWRVSPAGWRVGHLGFGGTAW